MNKRMLSMITALTIAAGIFGTAGADTISANMGKASIGGQTNLFNYSPVTGAVTAGPFVGLRSWQLGLPLDIFGPKLVTVTSRALIPGGTWQVVSVNAVGTGFMASALAPIPLAPPGLFLPATRGLPFVVPGGVCFIRALMTSGSSIATVNYNM